MPLKQHPSSSKWKTSTLPTHHGTLNLRHALKIHITLFTLRLSKCKDVRKKTIREKQRPKPPGCCRRGVGIRCASPTHGTLVYHKNRRVSRLRPKILSVKWTLHWTLYTSHSTQTILPASTIFREDSLSSSRGILQTGSEPGNMR